MQAVIGIMGRIAGRGAGFCITGPGMRIRISAGSFVQIQEKKCADSQLLADPADLAEKSEIHDGGAGQLVHIRKIAWPYFYETI